MLNNDGLLRAAHTMAFRAGAVSVEGERIWLRCVQPQKSITSTAFSTQIVRRAGSVLDMAAELTE